MKLLPRLCMATGTAAAGDSDGSSNKLGSTASSSSSTVSTSSSAAAAAVSEASSSTSLPSLSGAPSNSAGFLAASFTHLTTLLPEPTAATVLSAAAAVAPATDSFYGFIIARPASVALHDIFTLDATSASDSSDAAATATATAGSVKCVAHVHGGKAVTGHQDGTLRLWRHSTRAPARIRLAAVLPTVADRLRRYPVPSNHVPIRRHHRRLWIEHADAVSGVAASADGRLLFSVSWDRTLKVWAIPSLRCLQSLPAHDDAVNAVAVAPDGTAYTGSADRRVRVWAPRPASEHKTKKPVYHLVGTLSRHTAAVNAVAVACGGQMLYSAGNDRCVVVWEREESASHMVAIGALRGHRKAVLSVVACAGNDGLVVSGSADHTVRAWRRDADGRGHACVAVIDGHASAIRSIAVALLPGQKRRQGGDGVDGDEECRVCSASFDGEVRVWSLRLTTGS